MRSWFGLWRAVLHRSRADLPVVGAAWLLLLCAITLLVAGVIYGETVANGGLRREIETSSLEDRTVVVTMSSALDAVAGYDAGIRAPLADIFGPDGATVDRVTKAGTYADAATSTSDVTDLLQLAAYDGLDRHATLTAGTWPTAGRRPTEVTLPTSAASDLGVAVGSTLHLVNRVGAPQPVDLTVVGTWQPVPDDPFWLGGSLETTGVDVGPQFTTRGPIVATPEDLLALPGLRSVELSWRVIPDVTRIGIDDVDRLAADVATLPDRIKAVVPKDVTATITTGLPTRLAALSRAALVSRSEVLLLTLQFAILAGYAIVLVAGLLVDRRRSELALLRSRGAGRAQVTGMALSEAILLAIPAVAVAPFAAVGVVRLIGILGPLETSGIISAATLDERAFLVALAGGALGVLALTIPALIAGASPAEARAAAARQSGRTLAGRTGLDLALLVVAGIALWQLRLYGAPLTRDARGVLGIDPLLIAAPAIGLIAGAILAVRIIPRSAELAERVLERRRGLVSSLGARQLARRPLRYTRSALLLMLAAALGTFAVAHAATWDRSQADQAAYQAASDIRLIASSYADLPAWAMGPALRRVEGVAAAMPVERQSLDAGRAVNDGELVALDPTAAAAMLRLPPTASGADVSPTLAGLATARPGIHATDLPGDPTRIAVTVDTAFKNPDGTPPPENGGPLGSASLGVVLSDGDGRLHRIDLDEATLDGGRQRLTGDLVVHVGGESVAISGPVQLESIEIGLQPAQGTLLEGTLDLVGVEVGEGDGDAWTPVAFDAGGDGWGWRRADPDGSSAPPSVPYRAPDGHPGLIDLSDQRAIFGSGATIFTLTASGASPDAIPAVVSRTFSELSGAEVGDRVAVRAAGLPLELAVSGVVDTFPPLDPAKAFAVVDLQTLEAVRFQTTATTAPVQEWWVGLAPGTDAAAAERVVATLSGHPYAADRVLWRDAIDRALTSDPIPLALIGALALGALAALAFAAIGFVVSATVSTNERMGEFALLQALGLSHGQLAGWLTLEHAALLGVGVTVGVLLGLLLAWLVLPFATLTASGVAAVPAPVVVIPWAALVPLVVLAVILLVVTVAIVTRQLSAVRIGTVLRARDG